MASSENLPTVRAVILGTDALMAARPATPTQLARACLRAGFDFVAPISWGEELLATSVLNAVQVAPPSAAVVVHCPFVAEALRAEATPLPLCYFGVAPPVATARYVREAFKPRPVSITYAGRCPGAAAPDIDASILPEILLGQLVEAGVVPVEQPRYFDELLPPDRSRYASLPGGVPDPALLMAATGASLREAAPSTLATVAAGPDASDSIIIDLESSCGCVCGRDRFAVALLEPPRSTEPVVSASIVVNLTDDRVTNLAQELSSRPLLHRRSESLVVEATTRPPDVADAPTLSSEMVHAAADELPTAVDEWSLATPWMVGPETPGPEVTALPPATEPDAVALPQRDVEAAPSAAVVGEALPPRENELAEPEPQSASEPGPEPEVEWFAQLESDAAAFPEPEPYESSTSGAAHPEPIEVAPPFEESLFEESLFEGSLFEGMRFGPTTSTNASRVNAEMQSDDLAASPVGDREVRQPRADVAVERAVFTDGPEPTDEPIANRQLTSTLEPWARPSKPTKPPQPFQVHPSQLDHGDEATPPAISDESNENDPRKDSVGPSSAPVDAAAPVARSEAPVEALSQGLHPTRLADATVYPAAERRDTTDEPRTSDEPRARGPRIRHAALVVALGGLVLAGSVYAATLSGWFGGYSQTPGPDSTPPLLPAYEVTRPGAAIPTDTSMTRPDTARQADDSNHAPRPATHEVRPSTE